METIVHLRRPSLEGSQENEGGIEHNNEFDSGGSSWVGGCVSQPTGTVVVVSIIVFSSSK